MSSKEDSRSGSISTQLSSVDFVNNKNGVKKSQSTNNLANIANFLWESGKRRFSNVDAPQDQTNLLLNETSPDNNSNNNKVFESGLESADEVSYEEAAQLLQDSTNQKSIPYNSLDVSNNNVLSMDKTEVIPNINILPIETPFEKIKNAMTGENEITNNHLYLKKNVSSPPKKIVIIGVHGFFPHPNIRKLIGNPTGTSHRFIQEAEKSIREYYDKTDNELEIFSIALEKEGKVFERVDHFYDIICENETYLNKINQADLIYFVAHSQGCPTTLILLAKLLKNEIIIQSNDYNDDTTLLPKIGILCMAGIMNGPAYYKDRYWFTKLYFKFEGDRLLELFQFQNFDSLQMTILRESIEFLISKNCKICFVGSLTDQLVPLYSSCCYYLKPHPNIFRSCYIDNLNNTNLHKKQFLINLVRISLKLLNLGHTDNKMLLNVSQFLIGKMNGKGHSSLYYDSKVYLLGFRFVWETSDIPHDRKTVRLEQSGSLPNKLKLSFQKYHIEKLDFTNKLNTEMINKKLIWTSLGFLKNLQHLKDKTSGIWDFFLSNQDKDLANTNSFKNEFFLILESLWNWQPEVTDKDMTNNNNNNNSNSTPDDGTTISDLVYWKNGLVKLLIMNGYDKYITTKKD